MSRAQLAVVVFAISATQFTIPISVSAHKAHEEAAAAKAEQIREDEAPAAGASIDDTPAIAAPDGPTTEPDAAAVAPHREAHSISLEPTEASDAPPRPAASPGPFTMLGRLHPMATHFPIALFMVAGVAELLFATSRLPQFGNPVRFLVWSASASAVGAAPLGWIFAATSQTEVGWVLETHRWAGTVAALSGLLILWLCERAERNGGRRSAFRTALLLQVILIGATGFLGGSLLYGIDHMWRPA